MARFAAPLQQFLDINCNRLANGSIQWYENGTVVPKEVWQDVDFQIPQANPTPLDACGQTPALLQLDGVYTAVVMDSTDAVIGSPIDDVTGVGGGSSAGTIAADIGYTAPFTGAVQQTVKNRLGKRVYISDFAITPQPTGQRLEIQTVIDDLAALNAEYTLVFGDPGEYNIDLTTTSTAAAGAAVGLIMPSNIHIELRRGSNLRVLANNADSYALILYPSTTTNSYIFGGGQLIGDISDHLTGTGDDGNLLWFAGCTRCGALNVEANEAWGSSAYITEDDATNARSSEILLQDFVNRSNRNNGILIDNSDTVEIINYRAFGIGQGASQSGTSDGINITVVATTTRIGNININNCTVNGAFGDGVKIDLSAVAPSFDYGQNNIIFNGLNTYNTNTGFSAICFNAAVANSTFAGGIAVLGLYTENTQLESIEIDDFNVSVDTTSREYMIVMDKLTLRNPWQSNPGDALSSYIEIKTTNGGTSGNIGLSGITATYDDNSTANRPTYLVILVDDVGNRQLIISNIHNADTSALVTDKIASLVGTLEEPTIMDVGILTFSRNMIGNNGTETVMDAGRFIFAASTATNTTVPISVTKGTPSSTADDTFFAGSRGGQSGFINMDAAGNLSFSLSASDRRLKSDYAELTGTLEKLSKVPVYRGKMAMPGDEKTVLDWTYHIADEMAAEFPELVEGLQDAVDDEGKPIYQGIKQDKTLQLWAALGDAYSLLDSQGKALIELESRLRRVEDL